MAVIPPMARPMGLPVTRTCGSVRTQTHIGTTNPMKRSTGCAQTQPQSLNTPFFPHISKLFPQDFPGAAQSLRLGPDHGGGQPAEGSATILYQVCYPCVESFQIFYMYKYIYITYREIKCRSGRTKYWCRA